MYSERICISYISVFCGNNKITVVVNCNSIWISCIIMSGSNGNIFILTNGILNTNITMICVNVNVIHNINEVFNST